MPDQVWADQSKGVADPRAEARAPAERFGCGVRPPRLVVTTFLIASSFSLYGVPGSGE